MQVRWSGVTSSARSTSTSGFFRTANDISRHKALQCPTSGRSVRFPHVSQRARDYPAGKGAAEGDDTHRVGASNSDYTKCAGAANCNDAYRVDTADSDNAYRVDAANSNEVDRLNPATCKPAWKVHAGTVPAQLIGDKPSPVLMFPGCVGNCKTTPPKRQTIPAERTPCITYDKAPCHRHSRLRAGIQAGWGVDSRLHGSDDGGGRAEARLFKALRKQESKNAGCKAAIPWKKGFRFPSPYRSTGQASRE